MRLIDKGYIFNEKDIIEVLNVKNINLAKCMINLTHKIFYSSYTFTVSLYKLLQYQYFF